MRILFLIFISILAVMVNIGFITWVERTKDTQKYFKIAAIAGMMSILFCGCGSVFQQVIFCIVNAVLLLTAYIDFKTQEVYRIIWVIPMVIAGIGIPHTKTAVLCLVIFFALQLLLFSRFYGKADSFCFCLCAETIIMSNGQLIDCLIHMLVALALMFITNLCKHNVNKHLNLKKSEPFIPYIYASWLLILFWLNGGVNYVFL